MSTKADQGPVRKGQDARCGDPAVKRKAGGEQTDGRRPARRQRGGLKQVSELALPVLKPVLQRRTGMRIDLIAAWPAIIGEDYAGFTLPEKINWPRRAHEDDPFQPATLVIACEGAKALYFQAESGWVLERVNAFFGFDAIARLKIVQKPVHHLNKDRQKHDSDMVLDREAAQRLAKILDKIEDRDLRQKLETLGKGILARQQRGA